MTIASHSPSDTCTVHPIAVPILSCTLLLVTSALGYMWTRRKWTKYQLEKHLPTVVWTPRFINYDPREEEADIIEYDASNNESIDVPWTHLDHQNQRHKKMASSNITNILPKMERMGGPYGMYATVYGVSTKVVHVGHPLPARAILAGAGTVDVENRWLQSGSVVEGMRRALGMICKPIGWVAAASSTQNPSNKSKRRSSFVNGTSSSKSPAYDHFLNFSGQGVFTADGYDWKSKRTSVLHCLLGNDTMNQLEAEVNSSADGLLRDLKGSGVVNVVPVLQRATVGLIYRLITHDDVSFGSECVVEGDSGEDDHDICTDLSTSCSAETISPRSSSASLASMGAPCPIKAESNSPIHNPKEASSQNPILSLLPTYLQSVTKIRMIILAQSRSIWYLLPRWVYHLFSPMYREEERVMKPIRQFAQLACENARKGSPLEMLGERSSHGNGQGITKDLLDEAITLLFAGQDTSAATLSWTLHLLSLDPERQRRLVEEVTSSLTSDDGTREDGDFVSKAMIGQMPYLDAVIKESMRLYPVAPFVVRRLTSDIVVPKETNAPKGSAQNPASAAQTTTIPSSTFACIWIYALHRNPTLWHSPDEFLPERWIDPQLRQRDLGQDEPGAYIPFALGPRNCLGRPLAQVILRIMLARILWRYSVVDPRYEALKERAESDDIGKVDVKCLRKDMQAGFTVLPSNGVMLRFVERGAADD